MSHTQHELSAEFPQDVEILHKLKTGNSHFVTLADRYHDVNNEIHRIEIEAEAASDERAEALKKQRLTLLDEIGQLISAEKSAA
ncbi:hypothetical protein FHS61_003069 [Altererythrobacter atlanticus]|uniref:Uncharacterized protein n=1 Tax=Croceibacterium atlanticum TaxID=1267766 RepID=A0A0F7KTN9_9SPHN|nr:DUF465 domain-containing protein [Croceibacterium atlanticum]AKH42165.1 hypothetical protein WYH_01118 [Croceibacterium atlanticum]MBB5734022.1 hypothetical protein [Croceibacterium atlanticum]